jgi:hypothetical protein
MPAHIVGDAGRTDLDRDRHLVIGHFADFLQLHIEIVGPHPVGMAAAAALVDAGRQVAHLGHFLGHLQAQQHAAGAGLGALAGADLDHVGFLQIIGVHAVAARQILHDQLGRMLALLRVHAAFAGAGRDTAVGRRYAERPLGVDRERAEAHAGDHDRALQYQRARHLSLANDHPCVAALAVAFERHARQAGGGKHQIVEARQIVALGRLAANLIAPELGLLLNFLDGVGVPNAAIGGRSLKCAVHNASFQAAKSCLLKFHSERSDCSFLKDLGALIW